MKKVLIFIILITNCAFLKAPENSYYYNKEVIEDIYFRIEKERVYLELYNKVLDKLKEFEGLSLTAYKDTYGRSIGYGHFIKSYEKIPDNITKECAETLLKIDFEHAINTVEQMTGMNRYDNTTKVLALSHFVYNLGSGNFANSTMLHNIKRNLPIDNEIIRWTKVKVGNDYISHSHLKMRRNYELNLYNNA